MILFIHCIHFNLFNLFFSITFRNIWSTACAPSPLSLFYRPPTLASLKVTPRCCGSAASCQTPSTTTGESASTPTGRTKPLLSMATWRLWARWYTPLTSGPKKMSRRSGWHSVCMYMCVFGHVVRVRACASNCQCVILCLTCLSSRVIIQRPMLSTADCAVQL